MDQSDSADRMTASIAQAKRSLIAVTMVQQTVTTSIPRLQVILHELQVNVPIRRNGAMSAFVHVIAECSTDKFPGWRERIRFGSFFSEQFINRLRRNCRQELALGIRPGIRIPGLQQ